MEEVSKKLGSKGILDDEGEASCCWKNNIAVQQRQHCENYECDKKRDHSSKKPFSLGVNLKKAHRVDWI